MIAPQVFGLGAAFVVALFYFGYGLARVLLPASFAPYRVLLTPFVGMALVIVWDYLALFFGFELTRATWALLASATALNVFVLARRWRAHKTIASRPILPRAQWLVLVFALMAFLAAVAPLLERAFAVKRAPAVFLAVNSPGGSPVQSALIAGRIRALAEEKGKPVIAFCEDAAASGGYWIACAADEIWADPASLLGSIGVISSGFGFQEAIGRIGVERRLRTAGEEKSFLDPFRPEREPDAARLEELLAALHEEFKAWVRARRGARLKAAEAKVEKIRLAASGEAATAGGGSPALPSSAAARICTPSGTGSRQSQCALPASPPSPISRNGATGKGARSPKRLASQSCTPWRWS